MGFIETRQDITASVKEQTDIVRIIGEHVELKRSGVRYLGLCPFHGEKTPSFSVHGAQQFYHCFGCGESGDVFSFLMKYHNMEFPEALKQLADRLNIELPQNKVTEEEKKQQAVKQQMYDVTKKAADIYHRYLLRENGGEAGRKYLLERGIPEDIQNKYELGYAPSKEIAGWNFLAGKLSAEEALLAEKVGLLASNDRGGTYDRFRDRVLFPIHDIRGRVCGFGGRIVGEGQPKYMNSPESVIYNKSSSLLGLYQQSEAIRRARKVVIVEGNFDMISLVVHGCHNVVAPLGTALTSSQIRLVGRYAEEAILLFDGDNAGIKAAMRAAPFFLTEKLSARVALLPPGHDPDTYVRDKGVEALQELFDIAEELPEFMLSQLVRRHGLTLEGKSKIAEELKPLVAAASSSIQKSVIIAHFADKLAIDPGQLQTSMAHEIGPEIKQQTGAPVRKARPEKTQTAPLTPAQKRFVEFMILNPNSFRQLDDGNLRQILQGGVGEILYLQIKMMLGQAEDVQPEDILSALPDGPERNLVAEMLLNASKSERSNSNEEAKDEELKELIEWLTLEKLRNISKDLSNKIEEAVRSNDSKLLEQALQDHQKVEKEIQRLRE